MLASLAVAALLAAVPHATAQAPEAPPAADARTRDEFILVGKGEVKARSLLHSAVVCEFRKYIQGLPGVSSSRLLALRFTRDLGAEDLRQVLRGIVQGQPGYSPEELGAFLRPLAAVAKGSTLELRWGAGPTLEIRPQGAPRSQVPASGVAEALWSRLGGEAPGKPG